MCKLEGILKVEINSKVIYCNNSNYNNIDVPNKNETTSPKASGNDIEYTKSKSS